MSGDKCPVDHAGPAQTSAAGCPIDYKSAAAQECPVDHSAGSAWSKHLPHSSETFRTTHHIPNAPRVLSKDREISSIPRTDGDKWVYPSEAQFFAAMARKNHNPNAPDMRVVVPIHNAVNEVAWAHILKWEAGRGGESCGGPRLVSFKGRPGDLSPKARIRTLFGYTRPFDRHDWVVDRCGTRVRYVIDFYSGRNTQADSKVSFFLDVRPALDSWDAVKMTAGSLWDKWTSNLFRPTPGSRESNP
ncbi:hypothetical protein EWM64_g4860 [Hericium alpestre]|uniref:Holocytochrome c-type synthase n=1 Tax=Hericium alpestre TaxID=135208 RepID=A0A4Y9ZWF5_9AGAM|nr:hypothetical protein EWM64_g4860 [Hericium alpestre]